MGLHRGEDSTLSRLEEVLVNDGEWHHLQLDISSLGRPLSQHKAVLSLDQGLYLVGFLDLMMGPSLQSHVCVLENTLLLLHIFRPVWRWTASCASPS